MTFGAPQSVVCDRGMRNQGRMKDLLRIYAINLRYIGVEAPHQLGRGERHGGLFKELIYASVEERQVIGVQQVKMLVTETCMVKNMKLNHLGFTPYQWVLGKLPIDATSLIEEEADGRLLGVHEEIQEPEDEFGLRLQIRQGAKMAYTKVGSSRRARSASRPNPRSISTRRSCLLPPPRTMAWMDLGGSSEEMAGLQFG